MESAQNMESGEKQKKAYHFGSHVFDQGIGGDEP